MKDWIKKFKGIFDKKKQEDKEKEFLEKIQKKFEEKRKPRIEEQKQKEEDAIGDALGVLNDWHSAFGGTGAADVIDEIDELMKEMKNTTPEELKQYQKEINKLTDEAKKLQKDMAAAAKQVTVTGAYEKNLHLPVSGVFRTGDFEKAAEEMQKAQKDAEEKRNRNLIDDYRKALT